MIYYYSSSVSTVLPGGWLSLPLVGHTGVKSVVWRPLRFVLSVELRRSDARPRGVAQRPISFSLSLFSPSRLSDFDLLLLLLTACDVVAA